MISIGFRRSISAYIPYIRIVIVILSDIKSEDFFDIAIFVQSV